MYFPFIRGKKNELLAIYELSTQMAFSKLLTPIIEPVNLNPTTRNYIPKLIDESSVPIVFIMNPQNGDFAGFPSSHFKSLLDDIINRKLLTLGYYITEKTSYDEILNIMNEFSAFNFAFIHLSNSKIRDKLQYLTERIAYNIFIDDKVSTSYKNLFRNTKRILIKDSFNTEVRNADYCDDEYYSELFSTFNPDYYGFGDYQIVGSNYRESGGPAYAVALHLTYLKEHYGDEVWIRHFLSDDKQTTANVQGKYFQALRKLVDFLDRYNNTPETFAMIEYRKNNEDEIYHGLGYPKKLSIMHHIQLMIQLLSSR